MIFYTALIRLKYFKTIGKIPSLPIIKEDLHVNEEDNPIQDISKVVF